MSDQCELKAKGGLCCLDLCKGPTCGYFLPRKDLCPYSEGIICAAHNRSKCDKNCYFYRNRKNEKPPIGIVPKPIHDYKRHSDIKKAIARYAEADMPIPSEWIDEYNDLCKALEEHERKCGQ